MIRRLALPLLAMLAAAAPATQDRARERDLMILSVENMAATAGASESRSITPRVLAAMRLVPRHHFVPEDVRAHAYQNRPLPIGHDATISQPYIVALMTGLLEPGPRDHVLEVGTGSGYQAAVLSRLVAQVHSVEIVTPLARRAAAQLKALGYGNVVVRAGDGYAGWPEAAPFDAIIVTAGANHVPKPLLAQLKPGGRLVIPVGPDADNLVLTVIEKDARGRFTRRAVTPVRFVPLVRAKD
ncbi:protein-L-isoaspartate(D-aspartate) O-methyltransferase [Sphingosinicella sp. LY1275]|nr:protein-L-isoaspartate(D-aspartate) O-methyltransferase [Sphingosinicella sp. LY1275]MEA1013749.1 protein-L-isoaspartate(D-aspartate) O-methyltransferase [Sphingosinicella sp. LY1275]